MALKSCVLVCPDMGSDMQFLSSAVLCDQAHVHHADRSRNTGASHDFNQQQSAASLTRVHTAQLMKTE